MKTNVNLFIALILCAVIGGALYFLARPSQESLGWNPDEMYGDLSRPAYSGSAFTSATFSGSSNNGGVALSMQGGSLSSRTRAKSFSYAPATPSPITNTPSPIANGPSPIAYMTSGAEFRSFGGGGNGSAGAAGTFRTNTQSPIANGASSISSLPSPISNSQSSTSFVSQQGAGGSMQSAVVNNQYAVASSSSASTGLFGYELKTTFGTASYDDMYGAASNRRINGAMRLPGSGGSGADNGFADTWLAWLAKNASSFTGSDSDGYGLDYYELERAYRAWLAEWMAETGLTEEHAPSFWNFFDWFWGSLNGDGKLDFTWRDSNGNDQTVNMYWVPVGSFLPLLLMALMYVIILFVKRNKIAQL